MSESLLSLRDIHNDIGQYHILHSVDLEVPKGQVTMVPGRNGAGKATTLRRIMGTLLPHRGEMTFDGAPVTALNSALIARQGVAPVPEDMGIFAI